MFASEYIMNKKLVSWRSSLKLFTKEIAAYFVNATKLDARSLRVVSLKPAQPSQGNVLISYLIDPFLLKPGQIISNSHTRYWESFQIAKTFLDLGYEVDIIDYHNYIFVPRRDYTIFVDIRHNLQRISPLLNRDCIKIFHIDVAHILFQNAAEANRVLAVQQRRGVTLKPRRFERPNLGIEYADYSTMLGNEFTLNTFKYANKPIFPVPISTPLVYPWPEEKNFASCRKSFLWFGSGGLVRKGLDLVLEVFAQLPDYHLTICGPVYKEEDFEGAYHKELYQTPNIQTIGWIDISSSKFTQIANRCIGLIYPSCCEGQCGGVVTCLHAGLIPIISYETGVDVDDFGLLLKTCSINEIKEAIKSVSLLPIQELKTKARKAWEFARKNHTKETFTEKYRDAITKILATQTAPVQDS